MNLAGMPVTSLIVFYAFFKAALQHLSLIVLNGCIPASLGPWQNALRCAAALKAGHEVFMKNCKLEGSSWAKYWQTIQY
jgi:hypothetical protein